MPKKTQINKYSDFMYVLVSKSCIPVATMVALVL